jgi:anthranilate phosphoribosyltransferase
LKVTHTSAASRREHAFAPYIRILGKGKTGTRSLTREEARTAFGMLLDGKTEPLQTGAFLMLLRVKEESPEELAGFVDACRMHMESPGDTTADLDWSTYAGKKHQNPWYILSMLLLAQAGYRVFVHGSMGHTPERLYTEVAMREMGLPIASNWTEVRSHLDAYHLSYLPLREFCTPLEDLMQLRNLLGLRSPVNTLARMLNPLGAKASVQSVFHPAYAQLHQDADRLLGQPRAIVLKGESGEVEVKPHADTRLLLLHDGQSEEVRFSRTIPARVASVSAPACEPVLALWRDHMPDDYGLQATLMTTAAALVVCNPKLTEKGASAQAETLWQERNRSQLG